VGSASERPRAPVDLHLFVFFGRLSGRVLQNQQRQCHVVALRDEGPDSLRAKTTPVRVIAPVRLQQALPWQASDASESAIGGRPRLEEPSPPQRRLAGHRPVDEAVARTDEERRLGRELQPLQDRGGERHAVALGAVAEELQPNRLADDLLASGADQGEHGHSHGGSSLPTHMPGPAARARSSAAT
jgi:hypothetical protein